MNQIMRIKILKILTLALLSSFLISSCKTLKMSDLKPEPKNSRLLPTLETRIDLSSFESAYSLGSTNSNSVGAANGQIRTSNNGNTSLAGIGTSITNTTMSKDVRIQDAITIFDRDVKDNITDPFGDSKGFILCKINASNKKTKMGWAVLSGFTLLIPNIFGMPIGAYKITLDVDIEIYNKDQRLIGRYNANASNKKYMAAYWGYGKDVERVANIMAFRKVMNKIKIEIERDYDNLISKLDK